MGQPQSKTRLIRSKRGAVIALCFTGLVAALSFRNVVSHSPRKHPWLLDFDWLAYLHFRLPAWAVAGVNLGFYAGLFWGGVVLYRIAQGRERVLVIGWFAGIFLGLIQILVSASAATAIDYLKAIVIVIAFLAAADILLRMPASGYPRVDNQIIFSAEEITFPPELERDAFRADNGEFGWTRAQIPQVVNILRSAKLVILGGELWWVKDGSKAWDLIPQEDGRRAVYTWSGGRLPGESWPDFVERAAADALAHAERWPADLYLPPNVEGRILCNLSWVSELEFDQLMAYKKL